MTTVATRNLFIDSEIVQGTGNGLSFRLNLPPSSFSCKANQVMKMTLTNFEIRKNWYEVNQTNNVFWLQVTGGGTTKYVPVIIPPGSYRAFGTTNTASGVTSSASYSYANNDLCSALAFAVTKSLSSIQLNTSVFDSIGGVNVVSPAPGYAANAFFPSAPVATVAFNTVTRKFTITFPAANSGYVINGLVFLQLKNALPTGHPMITAVSNFNTAYGDPTFMDTHELLGGVPSRDNNVTGGTVATGNTVASNAYVTPYVGQLNTLEAIYIRLLSASTNNFQSPGLDRNLPNNYGLVPTNILARIPLPAAVYDDSIELLSFTEQGNGTFTCLIDARQMQNIEIMVSDDKGRFLQQVLAGQATSGNLSAKITLKWDIIQYDQSLNSLPPSLDVIKSLSPVGLVRPSDEIIRTVTDKQVSMVNKKQMKPSGSSFEPKMSLMNN